MNYFELHSLVKYAVHYHIGPAFGVKRLKSHKIRKWYNLERESISTGAMRNTDAAMLIVDIVNAEIGIGLEDNKGNGMTGIEKRQTALYKVNTSLVDTFLNMEERKVKFTTTISITKFCKFTSFFH